VNTVRTWEHVPNVEERICIKKHEVGDLSRPDSAERVCEVHGDRGLQRRDA